MQRGPVKVPLLLLAQHGGTCANISTDQESTLHFNEGQRIYLTGAVQCAHGGIGYVLTRAGSLDQSFSPNVSTSRLILSKSWCRRASCCRSFRSACCCALASASLICSGVRPSRNMRFNFPLDVGLCVCESPLRSCNSCQARVAVLITCVEDKGPSSADR